MIVNGAVLGILTGIPVIVIIALADRAFMLPYIPFDIFDFMVRVLPGFIIIPTIHLMSNILLFFNVASLSSAAKLTEQAMSLVIFAISGGVAGGILGYLAQYRNNVNLTIAGAVLGAVGLVTTTAIIASLGFPEAGIVPSILWIAAVLIGWGGIVGWQIGRIRIRTGEPASPVSSHVRSRFLLGDSAVSLLAVVVALIVFRAPADVEQSVAATNDTPDFRIEPAPGTRPEITPIEDFYRIDIDTRPPRIDGDSWRLDISGLVDRPAKLSLDDLRAYPPVSQYATMSCISNPIGGPLISNGLWTGVRLMTVLEDLGIQPEGTMVYVEAEDGFYEIVRHEDMIDPRTLLVYSLNGEPLNADQGFPLRFFVPNRYGMKQPKWITSLKIISDDGQGYWVDRGWDNDAVVQMTSVIDVVAKDHPDPETGAIPIGGIAYAGDRGISRVEVRIDDGDWVEAQLRTPALSELTWVQWRYDWPQSPGKHTASVRAYDGSGVMQTPEEHGEYPSGATGYHMLNFDI